MTKQYADRQRIDLRDRHQEAEAALRSAIARRRLVAENLIDTLSDQFSGQAQLQRIRAAETKVKHLIDNDGSIVDLVGCQQELNESIEIVLPLLSADSHPYGKLVDACVRGWNETIEPIDQTMLAYNDTVMTWNAFLQSGLGRWFGRSNDAAPLNCVDWDSDSSDAGSQSKRAKAST
tara:strand:- start:439393 stop:439923 length:531 start_codon:yes stop_codon:yes gene_type:complete